MLVFNMLTQVFPAVKMRLKGYRRFLEKVGGPLAGQGLDSLRDKEFHCLGGGVYALLAPGNLRRHVLDFIVAFQTISDYLDNLCDRMGLRDEMVFRQLHTAMLDSLNPGEESHSDYYRLYPGRDDGGYLAMLVDQCREALGHLPHYPQCKEQILASTQLYIDLQSYKHMELAAGEQQLAALYEDNAAAFPGLSWWEFAAACGSTLCIFSLAADGRSPANTWKNYMPWLNGLHILLDYYIDQAEDRLHGDMNLVSYYSLREQVERILMFYRMAERAAERLEEKEFHSLVVDGLLALYLSDAKAWSPELAAFTGEILAGTGLRARRLARLAGLLRRGGML
ncbi:MAG TPA: DUF2600 family protein [Bacillota bacterium]|nr:DUF2600 family protein [Bacillota bacterium]HPZ22330.1 DUF2600 family protein [Bacillota bacterium]HQD20229.1 DUF2600 family protein [Bacillota bacterium]